MAGGAGASQPGPWVEVSGGQGVQAGDYNVQNNYFTYQTLQTQVVRPSSAQVAWPIRVGDVPQQPPAFQHREDLLAALCKRSPGVSVHVVTGMRGVGKTQAAAAYARSRMADGWRLVAWVNAADMTLVLTGLGEVAARLGIGHRGKKSERAAAAVRNWLEVDGKQCLVVFDNVADVDGLRPYIPAGGDAQVVITSSLRTASNLGQPLPVDVFSEDEALAFFMERTGSADSRGAAELAAELGYLPLALTQAAAVIASQGLGYATYRDRWRTLPVGDYLVPSEGETYPHGIAEAVLLSLEAAEARDSEGLSAAVLDLIAVLSPVGVSRTLLYAAGDDGTFAGMTRSRHRRRKRDPQTVPRDVVDGTLAQLADASLLTFTMDKSRVNAHRLVMRVLRELRAREGRLTTVGLAVARLLRTVFDSLEPVWQHPEAAGELIQQTFALHEHFKSSLAVLPGAPAKDTAWGRLRQLTEIDLAETGIVEVNALQSLRAALLSLRASAVFNLHVLGDSAKAIDYGEPLLTDCERIAGDDHPATLTVRSNLASYYQAVGRLSDAIPLFERTLDDRQRVLGADHPSTLPSRSNLALGYQVAGRLGEAIPLFERTLTDSERVLGADHPNTLLVRSNLAAAYQVAGRLGEAIPLFERTLSDSERVLGADHPITLNSRNYLAASYQAGGRLGEAIPLFERALADSERILSADHPATRTIRENLACARSRTE